MQPSLTVELNTFKTQLRKIIANMQQYHELIDDKIIELNKELLPSMNEIQQRVERDVGDLCKDIDIYPKTSSIEHNLEHLDVTFFRTLSSCYLDEGYVLISQLALTEAELRNKLLTPVAVVPVKMICDFYFGVFLVSKEIIELKSAKSRIDENLPEIENALVELEACAENLGPLHVCGKRNVTVTETLNSLVGRCIADVETVSKILQQ